MGNIPDPVPIRALTENPWPSPSPLPTSDPSKVIDPVVAERFGRPNVVGMPATTAMNTDVVQNVTPEDSMKEMCDDIDRSFAQPLQKKGMGVIVSLLVVLKVGRVQVFYVLDISFIIIGRFMASPSSLYNEDVGLFEEIRVWVSVVEWFCGHLLQRWFENHSGPLRHVRNLSPPSPRHHSIANELCICVCVFSFLFFFLQLLPLL